jgi:polyphenol oxidase
VKKDSTWLPAFADLPGIKAGFTTRLGGLSPSPYASCNLGLLSGDSPENVAVNWQQTLATQGLAKHRLALPGLVHGREMAWVEGPGDPDRVVTTGGLRRHAPPSCDAVATQDRQWALAVTMADCMGILITDPTTGLIAAVHAGWRGTRDGILAVTLRQLLQAGRARAESLRLCFGPALSAPRLELGPEVTVTMDPQYLVPIVAAEKQGLDMRAWNHDQALTCGIRHDHIEAIPYCTFDNPELFFSYRRDGKTSGRMAAIIALV